MKCDQQSLGPIEIYTMILLILMAGLAILPLLYHSTHKQMPIAPAQMKALLSGQPSGHCVPHEEFPQSLSDHTLASPPPLSAEGVQIMGKLSNEVVFLSHQPAIFR